MKVLISLLAIPFKILLRLPRFIINAIRPFNQVYRKSNQYYVDYQKFMCISNMPEFGLIYHRLNPLDKAEEYYQCDMYMLNVYNGAYGSKLKATLFHEFTHIYDDELFVKKFCISNSDNTKRKKWVYKEIHAEQIRMLYMLGCTTINDIPQINHNTILKGLGSKKISFYDYCIEYRNELNNRIDIMKALQNGVLKMNLKQCCQDINYILYYIGIISIYKKYCTYDIENVMDLSYVANYLGQGINRLVEIYCENNIEDIQKCTIIESGNIRWQIIKYIVEELKIVKDV